jgi:hypothetical protein
LWLNQRQATLADSWARDSTSLARRECCTINRIVGQAPARPDLQELDGTADASTWAFIFSGWTFKKGINFKKLGKAIGPSVQTKKTFRQVHARIYHVIDGLFTLISLVSSLKLTLHW